MNPKPKHTLVVLIMLWLAVPVLLYSAGNQNGTGRAIAENTSDTSKIDLMLQISEELLKSQPTESFGYAGDALKIAEKIKDAVRIGLSFRSMADFYRVTAVYDKALQYYLLALKQFTETGDTLRMAQCYNEIGKVHMASGDFAEASINYRQALKLNIAIVSQPQIAVNYMNMGLNYLGADSVNKSLSYFLVSLIIADSLNMENEKIALMKNIGYSYARLGKNEEALGHFYKVLELLGERPDDITRSDAQLNIARGYYQMKNYPAALKYALLSFDLSGSRHFHNIYRDAAGLLSDIYAVRGDYRQAYSYVKIYRAVSDTILNAERAAELARLQTLYHVNQKEAENQSLRDQIFQNIRRVRTGTLLIIMVTAMALVLAAMLFLLNRMNNRQVALNKKLAAQSNELEALNDVKDKFFSFVAHNLKNPFNTIMGFSELMHRAADDKNIGKVREYSGLIYDLSAQVQKVLSNLLEWSRLQRRTFEVKPETVELTGLIKDVVEMNNKEASRKDIHLKISGEGNVFVVADRTMITAVLQNLVTNAIHFTPPSGHISIECSVEDQFTEVTITDTGVGMSKEKLDMLFDFNFSQSKLGVPDQGGAGLGLVICHEMLSKNGGTIQASSEPGKGSSFTFTLPVSVRHDSGRESEDDHSENTPQDVTENLLKSDIPVNEDLMFDLRMNVVPQFEEVTRVLSIEDLEHFARTLITTGEKYNHMALTGYGRSLQSLTLGHQIDQIIRILPRFGEYLKKIKLV